MPGRRRDDQRVTAALMRVREACEGGTPYVGLKEDMNEMGNRVNMSLLPHIRTALRGAIAADAIDGDDGRRWADWCENFTPAQTDVFEADIDEHGWQLDAIDLRDDVEELFQLKKWGREGRRLQRRHPLYFFR